MEQSHSLTEGKILGSLIRFALPVFLALFLQALYGGVDLLVVGQFAHTEDVSGVSSGSMLMQTVTMIITGLSMGITILVGQRIGARKPEEAGRAVGTGICLFAVFAVILTIVLVFGSGGPHMKDCHKEQVSENIQHTGNRYGKKRHFRIADSPKNRP